MNDSKENNSKEFFAKKVSESKTVVSILARPQHANFAGYVYGGFLLHEADSVAYICAAKHSGRYCVTASIDSVDFHKPVKIGHVITFKASVNYVHRTSMEVGVRIEAEDPITREKYHVATCYFTMVALDENFKPVEVPKILPETEEEKRRFEAGKKRYLQRMKRLGRL